MNHFDPNGVGACNGHIFGLPFSAETALLHIVPVPWEVTASYGRGSGEGPEAILAASPQIDLQHPDGPDVWKKGIWMDEINAKWKRKNADLMPLAQQLTHLLESPEPVAPGILEQLQGQINSGCEELLAEVEAVCMNKLKQGKLLGVIGGEHSISIAPLKALASCHDAFGILQIDAHADLRNAYMGLHHSHASVMRRALEINQVSQLVQVGVRDWCKEEATMIETCGNRISTWYDQKMKMALFHGQNWSTLCHSIVAQLPNKVYITFDIDGFDPSLCPDTGTPVPGGLQWAEALFLIREVVRSGRTIIGFDLVEVAPGNNEWNANVGARLLYQLTVYSLLSQANAHP